MHYDDLIDELIKDGHQHLRLCLNRRITDDDSEFLLEYLICTTGGDIVARKIDEDGHSWLQVFWTGPTSSVNLSEAIFDLDLNKRDEVSAMLSVFH